MRPDIGPPMPNPPSENASHRTMHARSLHHVTCPWDTCACVSLRERHQDALIKGKLHFPKSATHAQVHYKELGHMHVFQPKDDTRLQYGTHAQPRHVPRKLEHMHARHVPRKLEHMHFFFPKTRHAPRKLGHMHVFNRKMTHVHNVGRMHRSTFGRKRDTCPDNWDTCHVLNRKVTTACNLR